VVTPRSLAFALLLALAGGAPAADLPEIKAAGGLRVLVSADEVPEMFSFADGPAPGFEREILEGFARLHRLKLEVVKVASFDQIISKLLRGEGDVITGINDTEARRRQVAFTVEILPSRTLLVTREPRVLRTVSELGGERVGVLRGTTWEEAARAAGIPGSRIDSFPDMEGLLQALRDRKNAAVVMSLSDFALLRRRQPDLRAGPFLGTPGSAAWAVRKADVQLLRALDGYVENMRRTASWGRLAVTYFGNDALTLLGRAREAPQNE
jgi:ABC-type amino acid transport substrate-binding protein